MSDQQGNGFHVCVFSFVKYIGPLNDKQTP